MSITDSTYANLTHEVRIRQGCEFQQIPNLVTASETMTNGLFAYITTDGEFALADSTHPATHLVLKSGEPRLTATEIANKTGTVDVGEPVMAITGGPGTVDVPFATDIAQGDTITINSNGYAIKNPGGAGYVVGVANEDVTIPTGATFAYGEALITLPAQYRS